MDDVGTRKLFFPAAQLHKRSLDYRVVYANTFKEAVNRIASYLEDTSEQNQVIYFDGWGGLGASALLKSLAEHPPLPLRDKFDKFIHIDCSKWKNRRAFQRTIAQKLELPQYVMDIFDRQDENDDFNGIDEGSRVEIREVGRLIYQALQGRPFLMVFHNGSSKMVYLNDFGIPLPPIDPWSSKLWKVLWTFRGRFRSFPAGLKETIDFLDEELEDEKQHNSSSWLLSRPTRVDGEYWWAEILLEEAREIAHNTSRPGVTPELAATCCRYLLALMSSNDVVSLNFNWATHASNYWVCDGIIQDSERHKAWDIAAALREEMRIEEGDSNKSTGFFNLLDRKRWIVATESDYSSRHTLHFFLSTIKPETTSLFLARRKSEHPLPSNIFPRSNQLHVLKLCRCTFRFSSPPFLHCKNLRFLGLDNCMDFQKRRRAALHFIRERKDNCLDKPNKLEENKEEEKDTEIIEFFLRLWVLDICCTDWELNLYPNITEKMATNIREINVKKGRIWHKNQGWTWRHGHLQNIHKLRVIEPTCPWETESMDDFNDMVKLEHLDLSGNNTIQILPSLLCATGLNTLILDGCVGLERIGPGVVPPSLETFSLDAGRDDANEAKISCISMAGCARLVEFRLRGHLPNLEELDLSSTSIKTLNLRGEMVKVPSLRRVTLLGCECLRAVLWPENGMPKLMVLRIDTRGDTEVAKSPDGDCLLVSEEHDECLHARVAITDMRFLQSLVVEGDRDFFFLWKNSRFDLNLCLSCTSKDDAHNKEHIGNYMNGLVGSHHHKASIPKTQSMYSDINFDKATLDNDGSRARQIQPLDLHVEIGEGKNYDNVVNYRGIWSVIFLMNRAKSLLVHDNSFIATIIPESMMSIGEWNWKRTIVWSNLKSCHIERCSKLDTVFSTNYDIISFQELETFSAADLLMVRCIWSKGRVASNMDDKSFAKLQAIHLHFCPRLTFVLPLSWNYTLSSLETLHIVYCGDLSHVLPVEAEFLRKISTDHPGGVLEFPKLKHLHLHELPKLHQICEAKMFAPELKTIWVRGCWSLKRLPATTDCPDCRPVVDCEKDWWEKLEWDGKEGRHHPSLFMPRHSKYYKKKNLLRRTVLR